MALPVDLKYAETHEWARLETDGTVVVGITDFAVKELQDLIFIDLPKPGARIARGAPFGEIESVKAASELFAPLSGEVTAVNEALSRSLDPLASDPFGEGWMLRVKPDAPGEAALQGLLDGEGYAKITAEKHH